MEKKEKIKNIFPGDRIVIDEIIVIVTSKILLPKTAHYVIMTSGTCTTNELPLYRCLLGGADDEILKMY